MGPADDARPRGARPRRRRGPARARGPAWQIGLAGPVLTRAILDADAADAVVPEAVLEDVLADEPDEPDEPEA